MTLLDLEVDDDFGFDRVDLVTALSFEELAGTRRFTVPERLVPFVAVPSRRTVVFLVLSTVRDLSTSVPVRVLVVRSLIPVLLLPRWVLAPDLTAMALCREL